MPPKSWNDFSHLLNHDLIWRIRELSDLRQAIGEASSVSKPSLLRAFVPLLYAHWEGFIVFSAVKYLEFIAGKRLRLMDLNPHFGSIFYLKKLESLSSSKFKVSESIRLVKEIRCGSDARLSKAPPGIINSGANLGSDRFRTICEICAIGDDILNGREELIDIQMLRRRNEVAHGEWVAISVQEVDTLRNDITEIMRGFKDLLENEILLESFRRAK